MKKYRLKQWYPGLLEEWKGRDIIAEERNCLYIGFDPDNSMTVMQSFSKREVENNPDFWEEIANKPLFTTEDGVNVFNSGVTLWVVSPYAYIIERMSAGVFNHHSDKSIIAFSTKEAAKAWINENIPVFSRKEILEAIESSDYFSSGIYAKVCKTNLLKKKLNL